SNARCASAGRPRPPAGERLARTPFTMPYAEPGDMGKVAITVRLLRPNEGRTFLEIHSRSIRGLAAAHYPPEVIEAWSAPITDEILRRFLENRDGEIRLIAELDGKPVGLGAL